MKNVEITLYDIFGYLIPGCTAIIGIYLIAWWLFLPLNQDWSNVSLIGWIAFVGVAYVIGHFVQALSNVLCRFWFKDKVEQILVDPSLIPSNVLPLAKNAARCVIGLSDNESLEVKTLNEIMDNYIQHYGRNDIRDIYVYREGFYRGLSVALFIFAFGALIHITGGQRFIAVFGVNIMISKSFMGFTAILSIIMAFFMFMRYRRFTIHRVRNCLYSFLITFNTKKEGVL